MKEKIKEYFKFTWRVTSAHVIAYFIAGIVAMNAFYNPETFSQDDPLFRSITDPFLVLGGSVLQLIRGMVIALVLLPIHKVFTEGKYGFLKLGLLMFGLTVLSTFAAPAASIEGFIYTTRSLTDHLTSYPEAILWISLFVGILWTLYKFEKKAISITVIILLILTVFIGVAGYINVLQTGT